MIKLLLPALIPSWRFFDEITPSPRIEFALLQSEADVPQWQELERRPPTLSLWQMFTRMFHNPRWNEALFLVSCAERLSNNPTEHSRREIVNRILAQVGTQAPYMQFRLAFVSLNGAQLEKHIEYVSPVYAGAGHAA